MIDPTLIDAAGAGEPKAQPLTPAQKAQWNLFIDYLDKAGMKGNPVLDNRNKMMGMNLLSQYQKVNPAFNLTYDDVSRVQQELNDYRQDLVTKWKGGKVAADGVKTEADIMPGLSAPDGWLGSKTSSYKFPGASIITTTPQGKKVQNFGLDVAAYDAAMNMNNQKK